MFDYYHNFIPWFLYVRYSIMSKMSTKDKDSKTLPLDKLKQFFRISKGIISNAINLSDNLFKIWICFIYQIKFFNLGNYKSQEDYVFPSKIEKEISPDNPVHCRTKALKEISEDVLNNALEDVCILALVLLKLKFQYYWIMIINLIEVLSF